MQAGRGARPILDSLPQEDRPESDTAVLSPESVVMLPQVGPAGIDAGQQDPTDRAGPTDLSRPCPQHPRTSRARRGPGGQVGQHGPVSGSSLPNLAVDLLSAGPHVLFLPCSPPAPRFPSSTCLLPARPVLLTAYYYHPAQFGLLGGPVAWLEPGMHMHLVSLTVCVSCFFSWHQSFFQALVIKIAGNQWQLMSF